MQGHGNAKPITGQYIGKGSGQNQQLALIEQ